MHLTNRELWTVLHGMGLGALYLLGFGGGWASLHSLQSRLLTPQGIAERARRLKLGMWLMALLAWTTVFTGTFIVYHWYRATPPLGATNLSAFPKALLMAGPDTRSWHTFGMEWKEHIAWLVPFLTTSAAAIIQHYGRRLAELQAVRRIGMALLILAFSAAAVAGLLGAFINKAAALR